MNKSILFFTIATICFSAHAKKISKTEEFLNAKVGNEFAISREGNWCLTTISPANKIVLTSVEQKPDSGDKKSTKLFKFKVIANLRSKKEASGKVCKKREGKISFTKLSGTDLLEKHVAHVEICE
jgi:hypothetical protein